MPAVGFLERTKEIPESPMNYQTHVVLNHEAKVNQIHNRYFFALFRNNIGWQESCD